MLGNNFTTYPLLWFLVSLGSMIAVHLSYLGQCTSSKQIEIFEDTKITKDRKRISLKIKIMIDGLETWFNVFLFMNFSHSKMPPRNTSSFEFIMPNTVIMLVCRFGWGHGSTNSWGYWTPVSFGTVSVSLTDNPLGSRSWSRFWVNFGQFWIG